MTEISPWLRPPDSLVLSPAAIDVWRIPLLGSEDVEARSRTYLSPDELARADRFRFEKHRRRYIIGRAALRQILGRYLGRSPAAMSFVYNAHGKPSLPTDELQFNLTNSHELALVAVCKYGEIGIDVERMRDLRNASGMAERFFSQAECEHYQLLPDDAKRVGFFRIWTLKESYIKAHGKGLAIPLDKFAIMPRRSSGDYGVTSSDTNDDARWRFASWLLDEDYIAAITAERDVCQCRFYAFEPS